ncbi:MAG: 2'-5' RNA ligase family protein [Spirochaetales bacterium]|nr:2'-5' RNA ligase family protein [Spirochaetales bacterium]
MAYYDDPNTAFLLLAFPEISDLDRKWIDNFRREHDPLFYGVVEPHFTVVFPAFGIALADFAREVKEKTTGLSGFPFTLRCALLNNDRLSDYYHVFLAPDEGNSTIVKLHDRMYSGLLRRTMRLDVDFIPHIGIGCDLDAEKCKTLADGINAQNIEISGLVASLDIVAFSGGKVEPVETIRLT